MVDGSAELNCTTPVIDQYIMWSMLDSNTDLYHHPSVIITGEHNSSTLWINSTQLSDAGIYVCRVGQTESNFTVYIAGMGFTGTCCVSFNTSGE